MNDIPKYTLVVRYEEGRCDAVLGAYGFTKHIACNKLPDFIQERIALLRLMNKQEKGVIGRKIADYMFTVYLTHDEHQELDSIPSA